MGGKAFPETKRISSREALKDLFDTQVKLFKDVCTPFLIPVQIESKSSFGDLDMIGAIEDLKAVETHLRAHSLPYKLQGNVLNYQYEDHQVDIIFVPKDYQEFAQSFYSFSANSGVLSSVFRGSKFKLIPSGLYFEFYRPQTDFRKLIRVPFTHSKVLETLGLDSRKYVQGFKTDLEVFEFLVESPFLNYEKLPKYLGESGNDFLEDFGKYLKDNSLTEKKFKELKFFVPSQYFQFYKEYSKLEEHHQMNLRVKSKFNGNIVTDLTGLTRKDLGSFMIEFKNKYDIQFIDSKSSKEIEVLISELYSNKNG